MCSTPNVGFQRALCRETRSCDAAPSHDDRNDPAKSRGHEPLGGDLWEVAATSLLGVNEEGGKDLIQGQEREGQEGAEQTVWIDPSIEQI